MRKLQGKHVAKGAIRNSGLITSTIHLDPEVFAEVRERAIREGTSFGEQVRLLVEWGLEQAEEPRRKAP